MNEFQTHESISAGMKIVSMILLILAMVLNVVTVSLSNSSLFKINLTTVTAHVKLDSSLNQSLQSTLENDFSVVDTQHLILSLLVIILLVVSIYLTYINKSKISGILTTLAGLLAFIIFIRYFVLNSLNGTAVAADPSYTYVIKFGIGYYLLMLVTPILLISAFVKFVVKSNNEKAPKAF